MCKGLDAAARLLLLLVCLWSDNAVFNLPHKHDLSVNIDELPNNADDHKCNSPSFCSRWLLAPIKTINGTGRSNYPEEDDKDFPQQTHYNCRLVKLHCPDDDGDGEQNVKYHGNDVLSIHSDTPGYNSCN